MRSRDRLQCHGVSVHARGSSCARRHSLLAYLDVGVALHARGTKSVGLIVRHFTHVRATIARLDHCSTLVRVVRVIVIDNVSHSLTYPVRVCGVGPLRRV
jgi:hypothetical protein